MANYDDMKFALEAMTGGTNTIILDDIGLPSVMVVWPKQKNKDLIKDGSDIVHPGSIVNGVEKTFYVSKFQNVVYNNRAYSLPLRDPKTSINFDTAVSVCRAKGKGWGLMPYSLWCQIALWSKKNETMPRGNNQWGHDVTNTWEKGIQTSVEGGENHKGETARTATGSGPATWNHNWQADGIADMNGNVWEWCAGMRLKDGEINIIPYANSMLQEVSLEPESTVWKAIGKTGDTIAVGASGSLKWDWAENKLQLTDKAVSFTTDEGHGHSFKDMTLVSGLDAAPELAKALLLYPDDPGKDIYGGDWHWANTRGERLPLCGGGWFDGGGAGVFGVDLFYLRSHAVGGIGFRSAFCEL